MKIGIDCRSGINQYSGIGMYINSYVNNLSNKKNTYYLICYENYLIKNKSVNIKYIRIRKSNRHIENQIIIPYVLYKLKLDLYHVTHHDVFPILYFKKTIVSSMDIYWIDYKNNSSFFFKILYKQLSKISFRRAKKIITISQSTASRIINKLGVSKSKVIPILISCDFRYKKSNISTDFLDKIKPYVLYVGSMAERKNIIALRYIDDIIKRSEKKINFYLVTKLSGKTDISLDNFNYRTNFYFNHEDQDYDSMSKIYSNSLAFLFPSKYEGFGLPVLEAMKCGTIPIVSDSSSLPEIVRNKNFRFNYDDYKGFANKILEISDNKSLRNKFKKYFMKEAEKFDWNIISKKTEELYDKI